MHRPAALLARPAHRLKLALGLALAALSPSGCDADDDAADSSTDGGAGSGGDPSDGPRTGVWDYMNGGIQTNSCGTDDVYRDPDTSFTLTNNGNRSFTVQQGSEPDFTCTLDGSSFRCPSRLSSDVPVTGTNAVLRYNVSITGSLASTTAMSGTQQADITCEGSDCALAAALGYMLPCAYTVAFTATAR
jgi:hypothetical protein